MEKVNAQIYAEVLILLNYYLIPEEFNRIPQEKLEVLVNEADKNFVLEIDEKKPFSEQKISKEAKAMILSLYKKYFITEEQGKKLNQMLKSIESNSKTSISIEDRMKQINESKKTEIEQEEIKEEIKEEMTIYKESFFSKLINKIKTLFKK